MIPYILHVSVIVIVCFLFYKLFLQKETFYQLNRWTLLTCLAVSFILPLLPAPHGFSWRERMEWSPALVAGHVDATASAAGARTADRDKTASRAITARAGAIESRAGTIKPRSAAAEPGSDVIDIRSTGNEIVTTTPSPTATMTPLPASTLPPAATASPSPGPLSILLMIVHALFYCYLIGVCLFGAYFILQIAILCYQSNTQPVVRDGRYRIVETSGNRAPCSFGNNIFINPRLYDPATYQQILIHEKIHVSGRHTLDILLAEIAVVLQWFNPFIWLYRREVENNLEFLTDQSVLLHRGVERFTYQLSLLRVSAPHLPFSITNNYNQSLLKRRIVMMNSQRSPRLTVWKYFFLLPILTVLVCTLNKPAALGQAAAVKTDQSLSATAKTQAIALSADTVIRPAKTIANATATAPVNPDISVAGSAATIHQS